MSKPFQWNFFNDESDRIEVSICNKMRKVSSGLFSNSCTKLLTLGAIHKACPHIRKGRAVRQKWTNTDRGRGWLAKCPLRKKIIATIFVKYLANYAACVTFTSWSTPSFGMLLSKLSNRNTHACTSSIRMISFFYPSV